MWRKGGCVEERRVCGGEDGVWGREGCVRVILENVATSECCVCAYVCACVASVCCIPTRSWCTHINTHTYTNTYTHAYICLYTLAEPTMCSIMATLKPKYRRTRITWRQAFGHPQASQYQSDWLYKPIDMHLATKHRSI